MMCKLSVCKEREVVSMNRHPSTCEVMLSLEIDLNRTRSIREKGQKADAGRDNPSVQLYYKVVHLGRRSGRGIMYMRKQGDFTQDFCAALAAVSIKLAYFVLLSKVA